jgi:hypothetical protein
MIVDCRFVGGVYPEYRRRAHHRFWIFGLVEQDMTKTSRTAFSWFRSDNRKSAIENPKWVGIVTLVIAFAMCGAVAQAQQPSKIPRIGYLSVAPFSATPARVEAFRQGLRELGYVEGKNIVIQWRSAEGKLDRVSELAAELVCLNVDVIVTGGGEQPVPLRTRRGRSPLSWRRIAIR